MTINKYYILISEGITDCSLLEAILEKYLQYTPFENINELPPLFTEMVGTYPTTTGELKRQDSPTFYYKNHIGIAVKQANGYSNIPSKISSFIEIIEKLDHYDNFGGFLVFCDSDLKSKEEITSLFTRKLAEYDIPFNNDILTVYDHYVKCRLYLFPNNECGAIEKLLLECAHISYKELYSDSEKYKNSLLSDKYQELRKSHWATAEKIQAFYADKAHFGAISAVLKPDRPIRFTIKDHIIKRKFFNDYMQLPEFQSLHNFLIENIV